MCKPRDDCTIKVLPPLSTRFWQLNPGFSKYTTQGTYVVYYNRKVSRNLNVATNPHLAEATKVGFGNHAFTHISKEIPHLLDNRHGPSYHEVVKVKDGIAGKSFVFRVQIQKCNTLAFFLRSLQNVLSNYDSQFQTRAWNPNSIHERAILDICSSNVPTHRCKTGWWAPWIKIKIPRDGWQPSQALSSSISRPAIKSTFTEAKVSCDVNGEPLTFQKMMWNLHHNQREEAPPNTILTYQLSQEAAAHLECGISKSYKQTNHPRRLGKQNRYYGRCKTT